MELMFGWQRLHKDQELLQMLVGDFHQHLGIWRGRRRLGLMFCLIMGCPELGHQLQLLALPRTIPRIPPCACV